MGIAIAFLVVALDQAAKYLVQTKLLEGSSHPLIPGFLHLTYIMNPGAAFGMLAYRTLFFVLISVVVVSVIGYYYNKLPKDLVLLRVGLAMQAGGAIGNMIDRIRFGKVIDFLDFKVWSYIFNVADSGIVIGSVVLAWYLFRSEKQKNGVVNDQQSEG